MTIKIFELFQNFQNVRKPEKLTFPDSQTSQRLPELTKLKNFDEYSKKNQNSSN